MGVTGCDFTMDTLGHGEALLREQRLQQQRMLLDEARVPPEIVQDAELLEKSLSALRGKHCLQQDLHIVLRRSRGQL